jgi:hypothetical protein
MTAENKTSQSRPPQKHRIKFNPKRDAQPRVVAQANLTVVRMGCAVAIAFLVILVIQALWR